MVRGGEGGAANVTHPNLLSDRGHIFHCRMKHLSKEESIPTAFDDRCGCFCIQLNVCAQSFKEISRANIAG